MNPEPKINQTYLILRVEKGHGYSSIRKAALRVSPVLANQRLLSLFTHTIPFDFQFSWTFVGSQLKRLQSECEDIRIEVWAKRARRHFMIGCAFFPILESENLNQNAKLFKQRLTLVSKITDEEDIICPEIIVSLTTQTTLPEFTYNEVCREPELYWLKYGPESEADYISDSSDLMADVDSTDDKKSDIDTDDSGDGLKPHLEEKPKASDKQKKPTPDGEIKSLKPDEIHSNIPLLRSQNPQLLPAPQDTNDSMYDLTMKFEALLKSWVAEYLEEKSAINKDDEMKSRKSDEIHSMIPLLRSQNPQLLPAPQETNYSMYDLAMKFEALLKARVSKYLEEKSTANKDDSEDTKQNTEKSIVNKDDSEDTKQNAKKSTANKDDSEDIKQSTTTTSGQKYNETSSDSEEVFWGTKSKTKKKKNKQRNNPKTTHENPIVSPENLSNNPQNISNNETHNGAHDSKSNLPLPLAKKENNTEIINETPTGSTFNPANCFWIKKKKPKEEKGTERPTEDPISTTNLTTSIDQSITEKHTDKTAATLKLNIIPADSFTNLLLSPRPVISIKDTPVDVSEPLLPPITVIEPELCNTVHLAITSCTPAVVESQISDDKEEMLDNAAPAITISDNEETDICSELSNETCYDIPEIPLSGISEDILLTGRSEDMPLTSASEMRLIGRSEEIISTDRSEETPLTGGSEEMPLTGRSKDMSLTCRSEAMPFTEVNEIDVHERQDTQKTRSVETPDTAVKITTSSEPDSILYEKPIHILKRLAAIRKNTFHSNNLEEKPAECAKGSVEQAASSIKLSMSSEESFAASVNKNKLITNTMHVTNDAKEKLSNKNEACGEMSVKTTQKSLISQAGMLITPNHNKMMRNEAFTAVATNLKENHLHPNVNNSLAPSEMYIDTSVKPTKAAPTESIGTTSRINETASNKAFTADQDDEFENVEASEGNLKSPTSSCTSDELSLNSGRASIGFDSDLSELDGTSDMTLPSIEENIPAYEGQLPMDELLTENSKDVKSGEEAMGDLTNTIYNSVSEKVFPTMEYPNYPGKRCVLALSNIKEEGTDDEMEQEDDNDVEFHQFVVIMRIKSSKWYSTLTDTKTFVRLYNPSDKNILDTLKGSPMHTLDKLLLSATCRFYYVCPSANLLTTLHLYPPRVLICKMRNNKVITKGALNVARLKPKPQKERFHGHMSLVAKDRQLIGKLFVVVALEDLGILPKNQSAHNTECFFKSATPNINEGSHNEAHQCCIMNDLKKLSQLNEVLQETQSKLNEGYHKIIENHKIDCASNKGPCNDKRDLDDQGGISARTTFTDLTDSSSDIPEKEDSTRSHEPMEWDFYDSHDPVNIAGNDIVKNTFSKQDSHDKQLKEKMPTDIRIKIQEKIKGKMKEYQSSANEGFLENYNTNSQLQKSQSFTSTCTNERCIEDSYDYPCKQKAALKDNKTNDTQPQQNEENQEKIKEKMEEYQSFTELDDCQEGFDSKNNQSRKIQSFNNTDPNERFVEDNYDDHTKQKTEFKDNKISDIHPKTNVIQPEQTQTIENRPTEIMDLKSELELLKNQVTTQTAEQSPTAEYNLSMLLMCVKLEKEELEIKYFNQLKEVEKLKQNSSGTQIEESKDELEISKYDDQYEMMKKHINENSHALYGNQYLENQQITIEEPPLNDRPCETFTQNVQALQENTSLDEHTIADDILKEYLKEQIPTFVSGEFRKDRETPLEIPPKHEEKRFASEGTCSEECITYCQNCGAPNQNVPNKPSKEANFTADLIKKYIEEQICQFLNKELLDKQEVYSKRQYLMQKNVCQMCKLKCLHYDSNLGSVNTQNQSSDEQNEFIKKCLEEEILKFFNKSVEKQRPAWEIPKANMCRCSNELFDECKVSSGVKKCLEDQILTFFKGLERPKIHSREVTQSPNYEKITHSSHISQCNKQPENCYIPDDFIQKYFEKLEDKVCDKKLPEQQSPTFKELPKNKPKNIQPEIIIPEHFIKQYLEEKKNLFCHKQPVEPQQIHFQESSEIQSKLGALIEMTRNKSGEYKISDDLVRNPFEDNKQAVCNKQQESENVLKQGFKIPDEFIKKYLEEQREKIRNKQSEQLQTSFAEELSKHIQLTTKIPETNHEQGYKSSDEFIKKYFEEQIEIYNKQSEQQRTTKVHEPEFKISNEFNKKYLEQPRQNICNKQEERPQIFFNETPKNKPTFETFSKNIGEQGYKIPDEFIKKYLQEQVLKICNKQPEQQQTEKVLRQAPTIPDAFIKEYLEQQLEQPQPSFKEVPKTKSTSEKVFEAIHEQGYKIPDEFISKYLHEKMEKSCNKQPEQQPSAKEMPKNKLSFEKVLDTVHEQGYRIPDEFVKKYLDEQRETVHSKLPEQPQEVPKDEASFEKVIDTIGEQGYKIPDDFIKKYQEEQRLKHCNKQSGRPQTSFTEMPKNRSKAEALTDEIIRYSYQIPDNFKEKCFDNKLKVCIEKQSPKLEIPLQIPENKSNSPCCNTNNQSSNPQKDIRISEIRKRMQHIDGTLKKYYEEHSELIRANPANCNSPDVLYMIHTIHLLSEWFKLRTELEYLLAN